MRKIFIDTIPHANQRYETVGDYQTDRDGVEQVRVSYLKDWRHSMLIASHEFHEMFLARARGITDEMIDEFDFLFEEERKQGLHGENDEPGDDPRCPVYKEHQFCTALEKLLCHELGLNWQEYEKEIYNL